MPPDAPCPKPGPNPSLGSSHSPGPSHECPTMTSLKELRTSFNDVWTFSGILGPVWKWRWNGVEETSRRGLGAWNARACATPCPCEFACYVPMKLSDTAESSRLPATFLPAHV